MKHDSNLEDVERLYYLKSSVSGEAADLLKNIPVTDANYARAWGRLKSHYENTRALVNMCINTFLDLSPAQHESASALKALRNGTTELIETLETLERPVNDMSVDPTTRRDWGFPLGDTTTATTWKELDTFLKSRIQALEASPTQQPTTLTGGQSSQKRSLLPFKRVNSGLTVHNASKHVRCCSYCQGEHFISACDNFRSCSLDNRNAFVLDKQLCTNCLGMHRLSECKSTGTCFTCRRQHHTLLHRPRNPRVTSAGGPHQMNQSTNISTQNAALHSTQQPSGSLPIAAKPQASPGVASLAIIQVPPQPRSILLATARVSVTSERERTSYARALIDPCSEATFISESLAQRIKAPRQSAFVPVSGVGAVPSYTVKSKAVVKISSYLSTNNYWKVTALILPRLTEYVPSSKVMPNDCNFLKGLPLADPEMSSSDPIDMIIGADTYPLLIREGLRKGVDSDVIAQSTELGWILTGSLLPASTADSRPISSLPCTADEDLSTLLSRFWQQEEAVLDAPAFLSQDERDCETHFVETHRRNDDGRYVLRLPFKPNLFDLGDSTQVACSALNRTEQRFQRQPDFGEKYKDFMENYILPGHMKEVSPLQSAAKNLPSFILPHHGVFKSHGNTSKLRVVFNGSVKLPLGLSINDCLHTGPKLQLDLFDVLLQWRTYRYVFSGDIEKMFRQILIDERDQVFQQVLWRTTTVTIFNLCTVTYGLASSPYQAIRTLHQLAADEGANFPRAAEILQKHTYVDDIFAGADTSEEAAELKSELVELLKAGGFPLSKWVANHPDILSNVPAEQQADAQFLAWHQAEAVSMLGVAWQPLLDVFCFQVNFPIFSSRITKRSALSLIAQLYDPLGWITPVTVSLKIFMQSLWHGGIEWDQTLPMHLKHKWDTLVDDLPRLQHFSVPRWVGLSRDLRFAELHGFSDASERAFAACLYLRTVDSKGNVNSILLTSKSKVAPLKQVTLPRLELCGALLLVRLTHRVRRILSLENIDCHCWSDSTITLAWIREYPTAWKTYVANRVSEIQTTLPQASWNHIAGTNNPADLPSRGISATELATSSLWLHGPSFLTQTNASWVCAGNSDGRGLHEELPERRNTLCHTAAAPPVTDPPDPSFIKRFSRLSALLRAVARWLRPLMRARARLKNKNITEAEIKQINELTPSLLQHSLKAVIFWVQGLHFAKELSYFEKNNRTWPRKSSLIRLNPTVDQQVFIRVGGRLKHSLLHPDEKYPLILPLKSHLTKLLILDAHERTLHGGTQLTLNHLRQRVWILRGRQIVKWLIFRCLRCWRQRAQPTTQLMGDLPLQRVRQFRPFLHSGVDYAGPIHLRFSKGRGAKSYKGYISVFVCLSTRAVHLEVVTGYSAEDFLGAYKRFVARRGICATLKSDCGLNFVGADKELRLLLQQASTQ